MPLPDGVTYKVLGLIDDLIPPTVLEVRRLLWGFLWGMAQLASTVIAWSHWHRHHQARVRRYHYLYLVA
jgi:hypothetical protein